MTSKIEEATLVPSLDKALEQANLALEGFDYKISAFPPKSTGKYASKMPIFLVREDSKGQAAGIGLTHFAKLEADFEEADFAKNARTIEELTLAILAQNELHNDKTKYLLNARGSVFDVGNYAIEIVDDKFVMDGTKITTYPASSINAEGVCVFKKVEDFLYESDNSTIDRRVGKGMLFNTSTGEITRK